MLSKVFVQALIIFLFASSFSSVHATTSQLTPLYAARLVNPVTLDGRVTFPTEWSESTPLDLILAPFPPGPGQNVPARAWVKYDADWLYILLRVTWASPPLITGAMVVMDTGGNPEQFDDSDDMGLVTWVEMHQT
jgi:hypothetical protein